MEIMINSIKKDELLTSAHHHAKSMLGDACFHPLAICDGDSGNINNDPLEVFFDNNGLKFDRCYNLYRTPVDLSKYKTLAFFTTMAYPDKVEKLLDFDMSNLKSVIVIGEWAYELAKPLSKKLNIPLYAYDEVDECLVFADNYFSPNYFEDKFMS
jgi:hypothetical protein